jgi:hypothetical protein
MNIVAAPTETPAADTPAKAKATPKAKPTKAAAPPRVNKKQEQVLQMIALLKKSPDAIVFADLCDKVGQKYSQDIVAAMFALEAVGMIAAEDKGTYRWVGATS